MINNSDISIVGQFIINELGKELIKQNHRSTGKLIESLDYEVRMGGDLFSIIISSLNYGQFVNTGRKPHSKKVPIPVLVEWIRQKGIATNNKKVLGIAFAIQKTIEKEGSPTRNRIAKHGKGVEFIDDTLDRINSELNILVFNLLQKRVDIALRNLVQKV